MALEALFSTPLDTAIAAIISSRGEAVKMMSPEEKAYVDALGATVETLATAVRTMSDQIETQSRLLTETYTRTRTISPFLGAVMAEAAGGDQGELDRILAQTIGIAEGVQFEEGPVREIVLATVNELLEAAEAYFKGN